MAVGHRTISPGPGKPSRVAGVTETCDCDSRFYALCRHDLASAMPWTSRTHYPESTLNMDEQLDVVSTSDAGERELLEATNSDLYWDRVVDLRRHPPNASTDHGDDM